MPDPYPTPAEGGARYTQFDGDPTDYGKSVTVWEFKDGSASYQRDASQGIRRFYFEYENLTEDEQAIHDSHWDSCFGRFLGFTFTNPRTGEVLLNVHYEKYEGNRKPIRWRKARSVVLIYRPTSGGGGGILLPVLG